MTKDELKKEFEKYLKDSSDYYDPREPLTERKLLQMWLDCAEPREKRIEELKTKYLRATDEGTSFAHLKSLEYKLEKAKKLIKKMLDYGLCCVCERMTSKPSEIKAEAEQFLKEIEK